MNERTCEMVNVLSLVNCLLTLASTILTQNVLNVNKVTKRCGRLGYASICRDCIRYR